MFCSVYIRYRCWFNPCGWHISILCFLFHYACTCILFHYIFLPNRYRSHLFGSRMPPLHTLEILGGSLVGWQPDSTHWSVDCLLPTGIIVPLMVEREATLAEIKEVQFHGYRNNKHLNQLCRCLKNKQ